MAVVEIKCPNCGGAVQLDDTMEKGFCMYCGAAIQIKDEIQKVKIEHSGKVEISGKVKIDETEKMNNYYQLACNSLKTNNLKEAYSYFSKCLECDINNWKALFYKGFCAVKIDSTRSGELLQGMTDALKVLDEDKDSQFEDKLMIYKEAADYAKGLGLSITLPDKKYYFIDEQKARDYFTIAHRANTIMNRALKIFDDEIIQNYPKYEEMLKIDLDIALQIAKKCLCTVSYISDYKTKWVNGKPKTNRVLSQMSSPSATIDKLYKEDYISKINNLPSIKSALDDYDSHIKSYQDKLDLCKSKYEAYFANNPDTKKAYDKKYAGPYWIAVGICFLLSCISQSVLPRPASDIVGYILAAAFWALFILACIYSSKGEKIRKQIIKDMPEEIHDLKNQIDSISQKIKETQILKNKYISDNIKR